MATSSISASAPGAVDPDLVITHIFDAPRELVFQAWTQAEHLKHWWGPNGFTNPVCEVDLQPGGALQIHMRGPDGALYRMTSVFSEIVVPERLVVAGAALDEASNPLFEVVNTVTFEGRGSATGIVVRARVTMATPRATPYLSRMEHGCSQSIERLSAYVNIESQEPSA